MLLISFFLVIFLLNFFFLVLYQKWHPDKLKGEEAATSKFQEINEAYQGNWSLFCSIGDFCLSYSVLFIIFCWYLLFFWLLAN